MHERMNLISRQPAARKFRDWLGSASALHGPPCVVHPTSAPARDLLARCLPLQANALAIIALGFVGVGFSRGWRISAVRPWRPRTPRLQLQSGAWQHNLLTRLAHFRRSHSNVAVGGASSWWRVHWSVCQAGQSRSRLAQPLLGSPGLLIVGWLFGRLNERY